MKKTIVFGIFMITAISFSAQAWAQTAIPMQESLFLAGFYQEKAEDERQMITRYEQKKFKAMDRLEELQVEDRTAWARRVVNYYDRMIERSKRAAERYEKLMKQYSAQLQFARVVQASA